jgi:tRNA splicing ligase
MNFMERFIIKRITGRTGDMDMIRHKAVKKFAQEISNGIYKNYNPPKRHKKPLAMYESPLKRYRNFPEGF